MNITELTNALVKASEFEQIMPFGEISLIVLREGIECYYGNTNGYHKIKQHVQEYVKEVARVIASDKRVAELQLIQWVGELGIEMIMAKSCEYQMINKGMMPNKTAMIEQILMLGVMSEFRYIVPTSGRIVRKSLIKEINKQLNNY